MIKPEKLKKGDEIRIVAPSRSSKILSEDGILLATKRLEEIGLKVTFGAHMDESDLQNSASIASRVEDLHHTFSDPNVKSYAAIAISRH